jgi:hypothetical protein
MLASCAREEYNGVRAVPIPSRGGGDLMRIQQSACYPIMKPREMGYDDLFRACAEIGYAAVEMWGRAMSSMWDTGSRPRAT